MNILIIFLLVFAIVLFVLVVLNVAVPQKIINLLMLGLLIAILIYNGGWFSGREIL